MLIRLVSHPTDNPLHIDKLIELKNMPENLISDTRNGKRYLKEPWKPDPVANLPKGFKAHFPMEEFYTHTPPAEKGLEAIDDKIEIFALQLDYQNGQGEQMWKKIERMIDIMTPRDESIPQPLRVCNTRIEPFLIEPDEVPVVDMARTDTRNQVIAKPAPVTAAVGSLRCAICNKVFERETSMKMHKARTGHRERAAVSA